MFASAVLLHVKSSQAPVRMRHAGERLAAQRIAALPGGTLDQAMLLDAVEQLGSGIVETGRICRAACNSPCARCYRIRLLVQLDRAATVATLVCHGHWQSASCDC
ncbi:hypothetical protein OZ13_09630 [Xanthomonas cannabis pv. cannabis]|nr:hypothetical protein OZ13_09630 [Xanthomonas cannabis pv. cannabis]KHL59640.1 hypothetical protein OZ10_01850 [Xanthomonas cannabis pv. cannabis]